MSALLSVPITQELTLNFRITGLSPLPFQRYFNLPEDELAKSGIRRYVVDASPGFPDRMELADARIGATVLLLNHVCQPASTPYRASHAIFVREGATESYDRVNHVPESMRIRLLSLRGYDRSGMMIDADVIAGNAMETAMTQLFDNPSIGYIHVHHAKQGCYAARIDRA